MKTRSGFGVFRAAVAVLALLAAASAHAVEVRMSGEHYVYASSFVNRNFTGWSVDGSQTEDAFALWQRLRLRSDFTATESLGFSVWLQVDNTPWGNGAYTLDNPQVALQVFQAFLTFTLPGTGAEVTAGKFTTTLPQSGAFHGSMVLDTEYPSLAVRLPLAEGVDMVASYGRPLSYRNALEDLSVSPRGVLDLAFLSVPVTAGPVEFTPWAGLGLFMEASPGTPYFGPGDPPDLGYIRRQMLSLGYFTATPGFRQSTVPYLWGGLAFKADLPGDLAVHADLLAGSGGLGEASKNVRRGLFGDAALEYKGFTWAVPRLYAWWGSGEDRDIRNGSERLPTIVRTWNPGISYLFSTGQVYDNDTSILADPTGSWGLAATLDKIAVAQNLSSRLTVAWMRGTSHPVALRSAVALTGPGYMAVMGKNLAQGEHLLGLGFDCEYAVSESLKLVAETGYAHAGGLRKSVWGSRFVNAYQDSWKVAVGLLYTF